MFIVNAYRLYLAAGSMIGGTVAFTGLVNGLIHGAVRTFQDDTEAKTGEKPKETYKAPTLEENVILYKGLKLLYEGPSWVVDKVADAVKNGEIKILHSKFSETEQAQPASSGNVGGVNYEVHD